MAERRIENTPPTLPSAPFFGDACAPQSAGKMISLLQLSVVHQHIVSLSSGPLPGAPDGPVMHLYAPHSVALSGKRMLPMQPRNMRPWFIHRLTQAPPVLSTPGWAWQLLTTDPSLHFGNSSSPPPSLASFKSKLK